MPKSTKISRKKH